MCCGHRTVSLPLRTLNYWALGFRALGHPSSPLAIKCQKSTTGTRTTGELQDCGCYRYREQGIRTLGIARHQLTNGRTTKRLGRIHDKSAKISNFKRFRHCEIGTEMQFHWTEGQNPQISHVAIVGFGASGEVHKVLLIHSSPTSAFLLPI
jgi:hypothetical protein